MFIVGINLLLCVECVCGVWNYCSYRVVRDKQFSGRPHAIIVTRGRSHAIVAPIFLQEINDATFVKYKHSIARLWWL